MSAPAPEPAQEGKGSNDRFLTAGLPVTHGFTTRSGGVSQGAYASLNLGLSSKDQPHLVEANRDLLLEQLGFGRQQVSAFHQVHGSTVLDGRPGWFVTEADAATTADPGTLLVISMADCLPLLFHDPISGAVAAAHCGWRGTVLGLAAAVVRSMAERYGTRAQDLRVVMGPGIAGACYQVGAEVVARFGAAGFPASCYWPDEQAGRYRLDLPGANRWLLESQGVAPANVTDLRLCTHCDQERFYSYRRDAGVTGRHWAFISPRTGFRPEA